MIETLRCNHCHAANDISMGNQEDITSTIGDAPSFRCWNCRKKSWIVDIDDSEIKDILESEEDWDDSLSVEENLENANAEEGVYSAQAVNDYEWFLEATCPTLYYNTLSKTFEKGIWRGWLLDLISRNGGFNIFFLPRKKRGEMIKSIKGLYFDKMFYHRMLLADGFCADYGEGKEKLYELYCRKGQTKEVDWDSFNKKLDNLLSYLLQVDLSVTV